MMYQFPNYDQLIFICYKKKKKLYLIKFSQRFDVLCVHDIHTLPRNKLYSIHNVRIYI